MRSGAPPPVPTDDVADDLGLAPGEGLGLLMGLELRGLARARPGMAFQRADGSAFRKPYPVTYSVKDSPR